MEPIDGGLVVRDCQKSLSIWYLFGGYFCIFLVIIKCLCYFECMYFTPFSFIRCSFIPFMSGVSPPPTKNLWMVTLYVSLCTNLVLSHRKGSFDKASKLYFMYIALNYYAELLYYTIYYAIMYTVNPWLIPWGLICKNDF